MTPSLLNITPELSASVAQKTAAAQSLLATIARDYAPATFVNSLGAEDMVLTDLIVKSGLPIEIFSLDTGRLPLETYDLMAAVDQHYGLKLKVYFPQSAAVETYVRQHGINAFYESVALRKACCHMRKVEPLQRALAGKKAWINGMRAQQAATRDGLVVQLTTTVTAWKSSTRSPSGARRKCEPTSSRTACRTTRCTTSSTRASAARLARAPSRSARTSAPAAGGGKMPTQRNVAFI